MKHNDLVLLTEFTALGGAYLSPNVFLSVAFLIVCGLAAWKYDKEETTT